MKKPGGTMKVNCIWVYYRGIQGDVRLSTTGNVSFAGSNSALTAADLLEEKKNFVFFTGSKRPVNVFSRKKPKGSVTQKI